MSSQEGVTPISLAEAAKVVKKFFGGKAPVGMRSAMRY